MPQVRHTLDFIVALLFLVILRAIYVFSIPNAGVVPSGVDRPARARALHLLGRIQSAHFGVSYRT
jgi:hypothetical protein